MGNYLGHVELITTRFECIAGRINLGLDAPSVCCYHKAEYTLLLYPEGRRPDSRLRFYDNFWRIDSNIGMPIYTQ